MRHSEDIEGCSVPSREKDTERKPHSDLTKRAMGQALISSF